MKSPTFLLLLTSSVLFGQTGATLEGAGYSAPPPLEVAPGQVITLFFHGIGPMANGSLRSAEAGSTPLPATLAGLSLRVSQSQAAASDVPIFAVRQENDFTNSQSIDSTCLLTALKVQIPFELAGDVTTTTGPGTVTVVYSPVAQLTLSVDGQASRTFQLQPLPANPHMLTSCDVKWDTNSESICERHAYHGDAREVTQFEPAKRGETIVVYGFGLGQTTPAVRSGDVAQESARLVDSNGALRVKAVFSTIANALGSSPRIFSDADLNDPGSPIAFASLVAGQIGLYQLNIPIPLSLRLDIACSSEGPIRTNAALKIASSQGSEVIPLCVQP